MLVSLALLAACDGGGGGGGGTGPTTGTLRVNVTVTGTDPDAAFQVTLDGGTARDLTSAAAVEIAGVAAGQHTLALGGVAGNCAVQGANPVLATVTAGGTATAVFAVTCNPRQLVFNSNVNGSQDIYVVDRLGGGLTRLTDDSGADVRPHWSPDGKRIAFQSTRAGASKIYVMNADGTDQHALTPNNPQVQISPTWSPDGTRIAYATPAGVGIMNADGSNVTVVAPPVPRQPFLPAWSPDGTRIAFSIVGQTELQDDIWVLTVATGTFTRLTTDPAQDFAPAWLPDGRILFTSTRGTDDDIYVMNPDGTGVAPYLARPGSDNVAAVTADGQWLATAGYSPPFALRIWVRGPDGQLTLATPLPADANVTEGGPQWRP